VVNTTGAPITIANVSIPAGDIEAIAGSYAPCSVAPCGDGGNATSALLTQPGSVSAAGGNVYIADTQDQVIRVVNSSGVISLLAGTYSTTCTASSPGCGDGSPANAALLATPTGVTVDSDSDLLIADQNDDAIRKIVAPVQPTDDISTSMGLILNPAYSGDYSSTVTGHPANASLFTPAGVTSDAAGNFYIADSQNNAVRVVNNQKSSITIANVSIPSGTIKTIAGDGLACPGTPASCGDTGPATAAQLDGPASVALDAAGNIYIADALDLAIRKVNAQTGTITTVAGTGGPCSSLPCGDGGPATAATLDGPFGVTLDKNGNIYIDDGNNLGTNNDAIRVVNTQAAAIKVANVTIQPGNINTVAGTLQSACVPSTGVCGDGGPATDAKLNSPTGLALDSSGNIYIADFGDNRIRYVVNSTGVISTIAGTGTPCAAAPCGDNTPATQAELDEPFGVFVDVAGNVYVADTADNVVRTFTLDPAGKISSVAGNYFYGFLGDGAAATSAALANPAGLAADFEGNLLVTDVASFRLRTITRQVITHANATPSPSPLVFAGTIVAQDTSKATITITNNGNGTNLTVSSITLGGTNAADFKETNTCTTVAPDGGTCAVTVSFTPSALGARSGTLTITDNATNSPQVVPISGTGVGGITIAPSSQTVSAGDPGTYTVTVPAQGGFTGNVTLSCSAGVPTGAACKFSSNPVAPGKTSTLTITTAAPTSSLTAPALNHRSAPLYAVWLLLPAMLLSTAGLTAPKRRKLISYFLLALAISGMLFLAACGGGSSTSGGGGGGGTGGTPAGTYTITVQGSQGGVTSTQPVTLIVQ
jgi:hypothetical protein